MARKPRPLGNQTGTAWLRGWDCRKAQLAGQPSVGSNYSKRPHKDAFANGYAAAENPEEWQTRYAIRLRERGKGRT